MSGKIFVDTNIWVYTHRENSDDPRHEQAARVIADPSGLVISVQVLNEY